ncbi:MAG: histidine kinase, partial [Chitinophagaceae bacterium]|nr:histidine kinase [Chitinophagaceae bacterium]
MGTIRGFIKFNPNNIVTPITVPSNLIISKIEKEKNSNLEMELMTNVNKIDEIQLGKEINFLKLYFCRLPIQLFTEINFNYKIHKLIPQSVDITEKPTITLSDSEPGKFDIEINTNDATGSAGIYNKIIQYHVKQYFYVNKWFYFISTLFFLLLIIVYLYTLNIQKTQTFNTRNEIARDLHDEIGGSLTAISLYAEMLNENKPPTKTQIESIQFTTRKLLLSFRDSLWSLNTNSDTAQQFWDHIKD